MRTHSTTERRRRGIFHFDESVSKLAEACATLRPSEERPPVQLELERRGSVLQSMPTLATDSDGSPGASVDSNVLPEAPLERNSKEMKSLQQLSCQLHNDCENLSNSFCDAADRGCGPKVRSPSLSQQDGGMQRQGHLQWPQPRPQPTKRGATEESEGARTRTSKTE